MNEQNPMSILLTIHDDGTYEATSPTLGSFRTERWDTALEVLADWQHRLKQWKLWTQKAETDSYYGLCAAIAKHISNRDE